MGRERKERKEERKEERKKGRQAEGIGKGRKGEEGSAEDPQSWNFSGLLFSCGSPEVWRNVLSVMRLEILH